MCTSDCACRNCRVAAQEMEVMEFEAPGPFGEAEEIALAMELLSVASEEELEQFLGKMFKGVWKGIKKAGSFIGKIAKPLGGVLKGIAKTALPFVGTALGSFIPIPGVGSMVGGALGSAVAKALEMETEAFEGEEREFEMARRFVRIAGDAARHAAMASPGADPHQVAQRAIDAALRVYMPGMRQARQVGSGRWQRAPGGRIVIEL